MTGKHVIICNSIRQLDDVHTVGIYGMFLKINTLERDTLLKALNPGVINA